MYRGVERFRSRFITTMAANNLAKPNYLARETRTCLESGVCRNTWRVRGTPVMTGQRSAPGINSAHCLGLIDEANVPNTVGDMVASQQGPSADP